MKRKNLYFFAILSMLLIACGKQQEPKPLEITNKLNTENVVNRNMAGEVQDEVTPSIVRIEADDLIGSGVIFAETQEGLIIVTAGHVVNNTENIIITFVDGTKIEPNRVVISNQVDVAFLEVDVQAVNTKVYKRVNIDKNTSDHLEITDRIIVVGSTNEVASQAYEEIGRASCRERV